MRKAKEFKVLKFGGSSVETPQRIVKVINILEKYLEENKKIAVVFSAFGGVTDKLIETAKLASEGKKDYLKLLKLLETRHINAVKELVRENHSRVMEQLNNMFQELRNILQGVFLIKELTLRTQDFIMSFGERLSAFIICEAIKEYGYKATYLDTRNLIKTDRNFGNGKVNGKLTNSNIKDYFSKNSSLQIITGFIASTENNETITLGRGGSDYTASIFAAALNASEIEIWTDVDGIMTADPRKVKKAFPINAITFEEAMEMSHFGAKVIYPPTIQPALEKKIPIRIKNTFNTYFKGTLIAEKITSGPFPVKGISSIENISLLRVQGSGMIGVAGIAMRLFGALAKKKINIILITQASSEHSICFAVSPQSAPQAKKLIEDEFDLEIKARQIDEIVIEEGLSVIGVVGENMKRTPGISGRLFQSLGKNGINVVAVAQGSSELNISMIIDRFDETKALNVIHEAFFLSDTKGLHLYLAGTGQIGSTLLKQIQEQKSHLLKEYSLDIKVVGLINTKKMVFNERGINFRTWKEELAGGETSSPEEYVKKIKSLNLSNSIFVDCTASDEIVSFYKEILKSSISIVTPNKKANAGSYGCYRDLKNTASERGVKFLYETNVGAGLPIINTLNDLVSSGDKILRVEAVLSGTLSYIFNNFTGHRPFSAIVKEAMEKGYTEPDPREDLNATDFARKVLILARETGMALELQDIHIEPILPEHCSKANSLEDFFLELEKCDDYFEKIRTEADKKGKILRYISFLEGRNAHIKLKEVDREHPFFNLSGSDNIISFTTERYRHRPLVVKGPGAGAEVTAAGVFADIIRIANYLS